MTWPRSDDPWSWENHNAWRRAAFLCLCAAYFLVAVPCVFAARMVGFDYDDDPPEGHE